MGGFSLTIFWLRGSTASPARGTSIYVGSNSPGLRGRREIETSVRRPAAGTQGGVEKILLWGVGGFSLTIFWLRGSTASPARGTWAYVWTSSPEARGRREMCLRVGRSVVFFTVLKKCIIIITINFYINYYLYLTIAFFLLQVDTYNRK